MQDSKSHHANAKAQNPRRRIFTGAVAIVGSAGLAAAVMLPAGTALAAYQVTPIGSSVGSVVVGSAISLTNVTPTFNLGSTSTAPLVPGDTPLPVTGAVTMDVYTNYVGGYTVTVEAATDLTDPANTNPADVIPASDLSVQDTDAANTAAITYVPISDTGPTPVYSQATRSVGGLGDVLTEDWKFNTPIPDVTTGTYSVTLAFIASNNLTT